MVSRKSGALLLLAGLTTLQGCEEITLKEKDPLVDPALSSFYGIHTGFELDAGLGLSRLYQEATNEAQQFSTGDLLSPSDEEDELGIAETGDYRVDRDNLWLSVRNRSRFVRGAYELTGQYWYTLDLATETLSFQMRSFDVYNFDEKFFPIETTTGTYNCLSFEQLPEPRVRPLTLEVYSDGQAILIDKTQPAEDALPRQSMDLSVIGNYSRLEVDNFPGGWDGEVCHASEPNGFNKPFYDYLIGEYTAEDFNYQTCWSTRTVGGFQYEGSMLQFTQVGVPSVERKNPPPPQEPNGPPLPPPPPIASDIANMIEPDSDGVKGFKGFWPVRSNTVCIAESTDKATSDLSGTYWTGSAVLEGDQYFVSFSETSFDGARSYVNEELETSRGANLRVDGGTYFVERDGEALFNGRPAILSQDNDLVVLDLSDPGAQTVGLGFAIRKPGN